MKIRRKFRKRSIPKYEGGGTSSCPDGMVWDAMTGQCKPAPNMVWDASNSRYKPSVVSQNALLNNINEDIEISEIESETADLEAFSKQLAQEQAESDKLESEKFDSMIQTEINKDLEEEQDLSTVNTDPIVQKENQNYFNPYAGVDIPTAAYMFGENIGKGGDAKTAIASGAKLVLGLGRNITSGIGRAKRNAFQLKEFNEKRRESIQGQPTALGEDGGSFGDDILNLFDRVQFPAETEEEFNENILTGSKATGSNTGNENVELEDGEFLETPEGTPVKVEGKKHEQGGEKMNLPGGTDVLSDNLTLSKSNAKKLEEDYDIKVKTKDTYAKALDKYNKKIGLTDLIEEEESVIKEIKSQKEAAAEEGADESTLNVNLEFLSSKLKDITDAKAPLEKQSSEVFNKIFELQEAGKPKDEKAEEDTEESFEIGGTVYPKSQILSVAKRFGVDDDKAISIIKEMADGGNVKDRRKDFINQVRALGYEGDINEDNFVENIGEIQKYFAEKKPQAIIDYFTKSGVAITAKGVDKIKQSYPEVFEELGYDPKKASASFTEQERKDLQNKLIEGDKVGDDFWLDQFQDGKWEYRFPQIPIDTPSVEGVKQIEVPGIDIDIDNLINKTTSQVTTETDTKEEDEFEEFKGDKETGDEKRAKTDALLLPENMPLPPTGLQMPLKITRRYDRLDRVALSPDARLAELNRGVDAAMAKLDKLPSGQKEAAILQLQANKQAQADKIVAETEQRENQTNFNVDTFNVRQHDREEDARAIDALDYERRAFGALANTEDDFRRFFNTVQERNIKNFELINSINLLNQTSDNFRFGNEGVEFTGGADGTLEDSLNATRHKRAVSISNSSKSTSSKKTKKRRGGRIKRKY